MLEQYNLGEGETLSSFGISYSSAKPGYFSKTAYKGCEKAKTWVSHRNLPLCTGVVPQTKTKSRATEFNFTRENLRVVQVLYKNGKKLLGKSLPALSKIVGPCTLTIFGGTVVFSRFSSC
jgi:hypothetical protein